MQFKQYTSIKIRKIRLLIFKQLEKGIKELAWTRDLSAAKLQLRSSLLDEQIRHQ
jgi:hypothetical protein